MSVSSALRALVADDSPTARLLITSILESDPEIAVVGEATDGEEAVQLANRLRPDVITMDVHMPNMDGLEATREIMSTIPTPIVVVTANSPGDVELSLDVTAAGALIVVEKPRLGDGGRRTEAFEQQRARLIAMVKAMAHVKVVRRWTGRRQPARTMESRVSGETALGRGAGRIVAIAASTGGPAAVQRLLRGLPATLGVPVLLVQHMAQGFTPGLVHWLQQDCPLNVCVAEHRAALRPGTVYVAPDDRHLALADQHRIQLSSADPVMGFRPSASYLFESVAHVYGAQAVAVILTGMGNDGVAGLRNVHARGGVVLAQDEESSVVFGMPREAIRAGVVDVVGSLDELATHVRLATFMEASR